MTWKDLLKNQRVKPHQTSHEELHDLRAVVDRDLKDAKLDQLSADRRFATGLQCSPSADQNGLHAKAIG